MGSGQKPKLSLWQRYRAELLALGAGGLFFWLASLYLSYRARRYAYRLSLGLKAQQYHSAVESNLRVPMDDSLTLATDHYYPLTEGDYPTILIRTPYGRCATGGLFGYLMVFLGHRFAERGYHVLIQDVRGRFDSEGEFFPYVNEKADGLATLAWLEKQPWYNGAVGLWGPSYLGMVQWAIAAEAPQVKAMLPSITGSRLDLVLMPDGALDLGLVLRWMTLFYFMDKYRERRLSSTLMLQQVEMAITPAFKHLPLSNADEVATGGAVAFYQDWLEHAKPDDPLWMSLGESAQMQNINAPVHLVGGWYDFFLRSLLADYAALREAGKRPYLTIGPWHHFSRAFIMLDTLREGLNWFDVHLKGQTSNLREKPVQVYVMGLNQWRDLDDWPPESQEQAYYLQAGGGLSVAPCPETECDHYIYDPTDPTPIVGGTQFNLWAGAMDNRRLESRADLLTYSTEPLSEALTVMGAVRLILYARSSLEYTDFFGRLCDVHPNGRSINICDGLFRVEPQNINPLDDGIWCLEIDLWATAHCFKAGHRIRLQVSSGAHPRWNRNPGTGEPFATCTELRSAEQTIYHDLDHPSALVLPIHTA